MDVNGGHGDHPLSADASKCLCGRRERRAGLHEIVDEHDVRRARRPWINCCSRPCISGAVSERNVLQLRTRRRSKHLEKWRFERDRRRTSEFQRELRRRPDRHYHDVDGQCRNRSTETVRSANIDLSTISGGPRLRYFALLKSSPARVRPFGGAVT